MISYSAEQAFQSFIESLEDDIQSPEALAIEAQYRLDKLVALVDSSDWVQDDNGNVYPAGLGEEDRQAILENSRYSILDSVPKTEGPYSTNLTWQAVGSLISNLTIVVGYPNLTSFHLNVRETIYEDFTIRLNF